MFKKKLIMFFGFAFLGLLALNFYFEYFLSPEIAQETETKQYVGIFCGPKLMKKAEYDACMTKATEAMIKDKVLEKKEVIINKIVKVHQGKESFAVFKKEGPKIFIEAQKDHEFTSCVGSGFLKQFVAPDNSLEIELLSSNFLLVCTSEDKKLTTLFFSDNYDRNEVNKLSKALTQTIK